MLNAALLTIAKTGKQPKCPSTDERIKKMCYIYTMEYNSAIKKEWNLVICKNIDGPRGYNAKWSKSDKDKHLYVKPKKQMNKHNKIETELSI